MKFNVGLCLNYGKEGEFLFNFIIRDFLKFAEIIDFFEFLRIFSFEVDNDFFNEKEYGFNFVGKEC